MQEPSQSVQTSDVVAFVSEYKILECSCCQQVIGFQSRLTGEILCRQDCVVTHRNLQAIQRGNFQNINFRAPDIEALRAVSPPAVEAKHFKPLRPMQFSPVEALLPVQVQPVDETLQVVPSSPVEAVQASAPEPTRCYNINLAQAIVEKFEATLDIGEAPKAESKRLSQAKYFWNSCCFSSNLQHGADVKTLFIWGMNKYQICAEIDEPCLMDFQEKIQDYLIKLKPMKRIPELDEMVLGLYSDEYYRARVIEATEHGCKLVFVDFGDTNFCDFNSIREINDEIMKIPIWSVTVKLSRIPNHNSNLKLPETINEAILRPLQLELLEELTIGQKLEYEAKLWVSSDMTLNEMILDFLNEQN